MADLATIYAPWDHNAEALATDIGEKGVTVRQWRNRGAIPPQYWRKIIDASAEKGTPLAYDAFVTIAEQRAAA